MTDIPILSGTADFTVNGKVYQTWYTVFGDLKCGAVPLLALHGGPGLSHDYMLPNKTLCEKFGIPVVFYDQLGTGRSTSITDAPNEFWTIELFMSQVDNLLHHLDIFGKFDLLGHSWGGMLAADFAASRKPPGLRRLILANCPSSMKLAYEGINKYMEAFPPGILEMLRSHEADGTIDAPEYKEGQMQFVKKHICTLDPWPAELLASFAANEANPSVEKAMLGGFLLKVTGTLKDWDVEPRLHCITCPTLLLHSPTDEVHEIAFSAFFRGITKVKWVEFYHSSHLPHFEEPERYFEVVSQFLKY